MVSADIVASLGMGVAAHAESTHLKYLSYMHVVDSSGFECTILLHPTEGSGINTNTTISGNGGELPFILKMIKLSPAV